MQMRRHFTITAQSGLAIAAMLASCRSGFREAAEGVAAPSERSSAGDDPADVVLRQVAFARSTGGRIVKHSAGIYSTERPTQAFAPLDPAVLQAELDRVPHPKFVPLAKGGAAIETYTVTHDRHGPNGAVVIARLDDGTRFISNTAPDAGLWDQMQRQDFLGRRGRVQHDGQRNRFDPG